MSGPYGYGRSAPSYDPGDPPEDGWEEREESDCPDCAKLREQLAAAEAREKALRDALAFYADPNSQTPRWIDGGAGMPPLFDSPYILDMGRRARAALANAGEGEAVGNG